jgi:hypothetical protein
MAVAVEVKGFTQGQVIKIVTNKTSGTVNKHRSIGRQMTYLCTIRATGGSAPTVDQIKDEGYILFQDHPEQEVISSSANIDVYVFCDDGGAPGDQGRLVVWTA